MKEKKSVRPHASEHQIQAAIMDYLRLKRYFFWRANTGAAKIGDRFIRFGTKGQPDIMVLHEGTFYGIEVKSATGKMSEEQKEFKDSIKYHGGIYILAHSLEDVIACL